MEKIVSVSWGKDSTALLLKLLDEGEKIEEVVFFDTGVEFPQIYFNRDEMLETYLKPRGIKYTELRPPKRFLYYALEHPHKTRSGEIKYGYGWCGGMCRWGTTLKTRALDNYTKGKQVLIGLCADEEQRVAKLPPNKKAPLAEMGITEKEALEICYAHGFFFGGLYEIVKRASCWCCRNKNLKELKGYKEKMPEVWQRLVELEDLIGEPMKKTKWLWEIDL